MRQRERRTTLPGAQEHWQALGFSTLAQYRSWCIASGLRAGQRKGRREKEREQELRLQQVERVLPEPDTERQSERQVRKLHQSLLALAQSPESQRARLHPHIQSLRLYFRHAARFPGAQGAYVELLSRVQRHLLEETGRFTGFENAHRQGLLGLAQRHSWWLRPLSEWRPRQTTPKALVHELARHLLALYPVPPCFDEIWLSGDESRHRWFKLLGKGYNLCEADLPLRLTRKMAHLVMTEAPVELTELSRVFRWAQVRGHGGSDVLARAVAASALGEGFADEPFRESLVVFLVGGASQLPLRQVGPLIDYVRHERDSPRDPSDPDRLPEGFGFKGRSVAVLLQRMEAWHVRLRWRTQFAADFWRGCGLRGYVEQRGESRWELSEITRATELVAEGEAMHHCVASYGSSCIDGDASIWTLRCRDSEGLRRVLTIRLNRQRVVVEARGFANASLRYGHNGPEREYLRAGGEILQRWAKMRELTIAPDVI